MKLTVNEAITMIARMKGEQKSAIQVLGDEDLPAGIAYNVIRISDRLQMTVDRYNEIVRNLIAKHKEEDEDGNMVPKSDEDAEQFDEALSNLLAYEFEVNIDPVDVSALNGCNIKPAILARLSPILDHGDDDDGDPLEGYEA